MKYTLIKKNFVISLLADLVTISQALVAISKMDSTTYGFDDAISRAEKILKDFNQEVE